MRLFLHYTQGIWMYLCPMGCKELLNINTHFKLHPCVREGRFKEIAVRLTVSLLGFTV